MRARRRRSGRGTAGGGKKGYDRKDTYYLRAKSEGYRSRAAYKLVEVAERYQLIGRGARVLDLGCWPGGWLQVAVALVGPGGTVVGVDSKETDSLSGATVLRGDVRDAETLARLREAVPGGRYEVLLADLAPNLSGIRARDEARAAELNEIALGVAEELLEPGGAMVMKVFMSGETEALLRAARTLFSSVRLTAVAASRKGSAEQYLIARRRRPPADQAVP